LRVNDLTGWFEGLTVTTDGDSVISHAGAAALRLTAERTGLITALSRVLRRDGFTPGHDRGRVLTDTAVMMADGGNTVRGIDVLRHQRDLLGEVASPATVSRALAEIDPATLQRMDAARAQVRARVWDLIAARARAHPAGPGTHRGPRRDDRAAYRRASHRRLLP
jgi:phage FluMu protein gp41